MNPALTEWELLSRVYGIRREHGEKAWAFIAQQIGELLLLGDENGARQWRDIEDRLRELNRGGSLRQR
jgi:hypothetical protein